MDDHLSADALERAVLVTPLHRAVYKILVEAGFKDAHQGGEDGPPLGMASILTSTLSAYPSEEQLVDAMSWGHREYWDKMRPVARKLLTLVESDGSPA
jgi:hypothetical protein